MELLGIREVLVGEDHLLLMPRHFPGWTGGRQIEVGYDAIAAVSLVEPCQEERGIFVLRLHDGSELTVPFARQATLDMRTAHRLACERVCAEGLTSPGP